MSQNRDFLINLILVYHNLIQITIKKSLLSEQFQRDVELSLSY